MKPLKRRASAKPLRQPTLDELVAQVRGNLMFARILYGTGKLEMMQRVNEQERAVKVELEMALDDDNAKAAAASKLKAVMKKQPRPKSG